MKNFGIRLKKLREDRGLSLEELAKDMGIKTCGLMLLENNRIALNFKSIIKLAKYFNVTVDYLLGL